MRIKSISCEDFKSVTAYFEPARLTLLHGANGSGKTARLLALQYAITGRTPFGARPEDVFKLAGPRGCHVAVHLDDGFGWSRRLRMHPMGKTLQTLINIVGHGAMGVRTAEPIVREHVGDFAPMFDLGEFLNLSDDKRRDFVLALCAEASSGTAGDVGELPHRIVVETLKLKLGEGTVRAHPQLHMGHTDPLIAQLGEHDRKCLSRILDQIKPELQGDLTTSIGAALQKAKELASHSKRAKEEATQASRKLAEEKADLEVVAESVTSLREGREVFAQQREGLLTQIADQQGRQKGRDALKSALDDNEGRQIRNVLDQQEAESEPEADPEKIAELERQAAALEPQATNEAEHRAAVTAAEERNGAAYIADTKASRRLESAQVRAGTLGREIERRKVDVERAEASPWRAAMKLADALNPALNCKTPEVIDLWAGLYDLIRRNADTDYLTQLRMDLASKRKQRDALDVEIADAGVAAHKARQGAQEAQAAMEAAKDALAAAVTKEQADRKNRLVLLDDAGRLRRAMDDRTHRVKALREDAQRLSDERVDYERRLNALDAEGGFIPIEQLEEQRRTLEEALAVRDEHIRARERFAVLETELTKCIVNSEAEGAMHEMCQTVAAAIRVLREQLMAELVRPLLDRLNRFLAIAAPGRTAYCELINARGRPIIQKGADNRLTFYHPRSPFELGWIVQGGGVVSLGVGNDIMMAAGPERKIPLPALSGGERALFGAGLAYALVSLADTPLKLLLLEASEVDSQNLRRMLEALTVVQADLSNVIVATHNDPGWRNESWKVVELDGATQ